MDSTHYSVKVGNETSAQEVISVNYPFNDSVTVKDLPIDLLEAINKERSKSVVTVDFVKLVNERVEPRTTVLKLDMLNSIYFFYRANHLFSYLIELTPLETVLVRFDAGYTQHYAGSSKVKEFSELFKIMVNDTGEDIFDRYYLRFNHNLFEAFGSTQKVIPINTETKELTNKSIAEMQDDEIESTINNLKAELIKRRLDQLKQSLSKLEELFEDNDKKFHMTLRNKRVGIGGWKCPCCAPPPSKRKAFCRKLKRGQEKTFIRNYITEGLLED